MTATATHPPLSDRQKRMLGFIREYLSEHGYAPSIREIAATEHTSTAPIAYNLGQLERLGYLEIGRLDHNIAAARGLRLVEPAGACACGCPCCTP
jgi:repressor LexA